MANEDSPKPVVHQPVGESLALYGSSADDAIQHQVHSELVHRTDEPVVHMHLWNEDCVGKLEHSFESVHEQTHEMKSSLANPIHHALQMRTPLQVRFCNTWQVASDYTVQVALRGQPLLDIRLTGATVATPQPCPEDECAPDPTAAVHP